MNWKSTPLVSHEVMVKLIANTTTKTGLKIKAAIDRRKFPKGQKVSDEDMQQINITRAEFHGDWNYTIAPQKQ